MTEEKQEPLISAFLLDEKGGAREMDWETVKTWKPDDGVLWAHLNHDSEEALAWLNNGADLSNIFSHALASEETRPRLLIEENELMFILRAVNLNPGAESDDMVQLRFYSDGKRFFSMRKRKVAAVEDLKKDLKKSKGPVDAASLLARLCDRTAANISKVIDQLQDNVDEMEETVLKGDTTDLRQDLAEMRHQGIALKRFILPQRDALLEMMEDAPDWIDENNRNTLDRVAERTNRFVEDLSTVRERAAVVQDELTNRLNERLNNIMYVLSITAAIFLPLGFVTGLFGVNLGGIPGTEDPDSFTIMCIAMVVIVALQIWMFKKWKWF